MGMDYSNTSFDVQYLYKLIEEESFASGEGEIVKAEALQAYIDDLCQKVKIDRKYKVVINCRNGVASLVNPQLFRQAGMEVVEQFCEQDFDFPNGNANPSLEAMMEETGRKVVEEKADIGFAFDGDGDRLGIVDEKGRNIYPDKILILLARLVLKKNPGAKIVFDVKCTQALADDVEAHGGEAVMWKTGHAHIKKKAHEIKAALAGERSGHIFLFDGYYGFDDASIVGLKLLEFLSQEGKSLSEVMETIPQYHSSPVYHAHCADEVKYRVVERVVEKFKQKFDKVIDVNGARVVFEDGWGLVRASSNEPVLVLVFEAKTEERLKEIQEIFKKELEDFPEISREWENG